ncbi:type II toxin-antitoxin system RelE/ParE family toxin [Pedobacter deserti]|uniref:type II toxin-antitoxin system RelE/ParE family toxin n=1 Tax=Pedobacter deserti TaxID=2817382 RepID=UPI00351E7ECC
MYQIKIHAQALDDIREAASWYDEQSNGLGSRFKDVVIAHINRLKRSASIYAIRYDDVRCLLIKKFPFIVHFSINEETRTITIYAVFHTSLNPEIWKKRR